ncbi:37790_t:CDS:2 [Gigaspora margarita]|uniref:37790_t:CDS:1 n=1 Tax=Gigaspora margarita TaxID=4874 RepID=A0ABN7V1S0_GIGMA|nr:37790_t:CDS:2 [Gigaspora margarita]
MVLRFLLKDYRSEWSSIYECAEQFISKKINDLEIEEIVVAIGKKGVRERFDIVNPNHKKVLKRISQDWSTIIVVAIGRKGVRKRFDIAKFYYTNEEDEAANDGEVDLDVERIAATETSPNEDQIIENARLLEISTANVNPVHPAMQGGFGIG